MDEKKTVTTVAQVIESVCEEMCSDFCRYSTEPTDDETCRHFEDCPLNKLQ